MASPTADGAALRREDPPLVTGAAHYSDDLVFPGTLHAVFVRAPLAHGRIVGVDGSLAAGLPGVAGVFGAADLDLPPLPAGDAPAAMARPVLAVDVVRFQGEAVAVVVAETRAQALDAPEAVAKTMKLLAAAPTQEEQIAYVLALRTVRNGWTLWPSRIAQLIVFSASM